MSWPGLSWPGLSWPGAVRTASGGMLDAGPGGGGPALGSRLGVLNTALMTTRDRVRDLGIFKALAVAGALRRPAGRPAPGQRPPCTPSEHGVAWTP